LIRNVDSYHQIYHCYVGRPFPITESSKYSAETSEIDIRKDVTKNVSESIRGKKDDEQQQIREIKEKEEKLLEESKREETDPYDEYITQRVKLAQLSFTYLEHQKKLVEIKDIIIKTRSLIDDMNNEFPTFKDSYYEKYMKARKEAGIKEDEKDTQENFIKFLVQEADLGF
jgi:prenyltransferase beta subunit